MKVLVTGVAGFIGSNVARRLLDEGHEVVGIDSLTDYYEPAMKRSNLTRLTSERFEFIEQDIVSADLDALLQGVAVVIHQAGQPGVRSSWGAEFDIYVSANVLATQKLLEASTRADTRIRFVYASSSSVYGNAEVYPTVEATRPAPLSPYGVTKLAGEHLVNLYAANFGLSTVSLRYFTVYGPRQRTDMAFTRFARAAVRNEPITIFGTGTQIRDFTYVDDVVDANMLVAFKPVVPGAVFNVAGGGSTTVNEVIAILEELHGYPLTVTRQAGVKGDVYRTGGSTDAINRAVGWQPVTPLREGLAKQYEWAASWFG
ncbi:NAD-dependent epimerase/dehydratase family protein [Mycobacterium sp. C3-094]